ncbi:hypothetical protein FRC07_008103 [Ceratobasidium sp. 392]|nr:hypothetical protein FRC07_008103 [Ceratobasidium sp. 392]
MEDPSLVEVIVRDAIEEDLPFMNEVYNYNILNSVGLFFTRPVTDEYRLKWFRGLRERYFNGQPYPCLLGLSRRPGGEETKFGYVCYIPWVEGEEFQPFGYGAKLLNAILAHQSTKQLRGIIAGITTQNDPSIKFFEKHGFIYSGQLNNVGYKFERWLDVANYTFYPDGIPDRTISQIERRNSLTDPAVCHDTATTITCGDVQMDDLSAGMNLARRMPDKN